MTATMHFLRNKLFLILSIILIIFTYSLAEASLTIEDEKKLGREFYDNLGKNNLIYRNPRVDEYIGKIGRRILTGLPNSPFDFRFSVINSTAINAFATPGGYVYVNMGLINLVENEGELAGVLAHEIAHVSARHIADIVDKSAKVSMASLAGILAGIFLGGGGDLTAAMTTLTMAAASTMSLKYSRENALTSSWRTDVSMATAGCSASLHPLNSRNWRPSSGPRYSGCS